MIIIKRLLCIEVIRCNIDGAIFFFPNVLFRNGQTRLTPYNILVGRYVYIDFVWTFYRKKKKSKKPSKFDIRTCNNPRTTSGRAWMLIRDALLSSHGIFAYDVVPPPVVGTTMRAIRVLKSPRDRSRRLIAIFWTCDVMRLVRSWSGGVQEDEAIASLPPPLHWNPEARKVPGLTKKTRFVHSKIDLFHRHDLHPEQRDRSDDGSFISIPNL